jgi:uncharacterized protein (DUF433 family)
MEGTRIGPADILAAVALGIAFGLLIAWGI